jgi:hypothetical protein
MRHIRDLLLPATVLAALAVLIAVRSVEASAHSAASAVPVSWLLCDELPASVSDAIGRGAEARELVDDTCSLLSGWAATRWDDDDDDE